MRRWQYEIRRTADAAESYRHHYAEDWDETGDHEIYPPVRHVSLLWLWRTTLFLETEASDSTWGRRVWDQAQMRYHWTAWHWLIWAWLRTVIGVLICRWERWREPEWLKDPNTMLYFIPEAEG